MSLQDGQFLPTTQIYDTTDQKELLVRLYQSINNISMVVNAKESGNYYLTEFINSDVYFNPVSTNQSELRPVFRKVINFGVLAPGLHDQLHNLVIGTTWAFVRIYGAASMTNAYYPIPNQNIELYLDGTKVYINNGTALTFTTCTVVLEYLKN